MPVSEIDKVPARRGARAYLFATAGGQVCALARYTLLARILGPADLGLAATLILTAAFFDTVTDSGADRFLIQDAQGDSPIAQRLVQMVVLGRGMLLAVLLVALSHPIAAFFHQPEIAPGLVLLALYPLVSGFIHMDQRRVQRAHDFRAEGAAFICGEAASLVAAISFAWLTHSFTAAAVGLIVRSLAIVTVSHLLAKRPYRVGFDMDLARRMARFSVPLVINGVFLYLGSHTDRIVVIDTMGPAPLGRYSAVLLLIYYPAQILVRYLSALNLPKVAATRDRPAEREKAIESLGGQVVLLGCAMAIGFAVVAPRAITLLYGRRFKEGASTVALIGILQSSRFLRMWPTNLAMGFGRSEIVMTNSLVRLVGVPLAFAGERFIGGLPGVAAGFTVGEMIAMALARLNVNHAVGRPLFSDFDRIALFILVAAAILAWIWILAAPHPVPILAALGGSAVLLAWAIRRERPTLEWTLRTGLRAAAPLWARSPARNRG